jgi:hypothetical protein
MSLLHSLEHPTDARVYRGDLPVSHRYTAGIAGEKFLRALKDEGKIYGTRCPKCNFTYVPARLYCERDMTHLDDSAWVQMSAEGELLSFSAVHVDLDGNRLDSPQWVGLVRLDGASGALLHYLGDVKPDALRVGTRVQAVLKPKKDRVGSIKDIAYFKPV